MKKDSVEMEKENSRLTEEIERMKEEIARLSEDNERLKELEPIITSLSQFDLYVSNSSQLNVQDNKIIHVGSSSYETCVFKGILEPVCIITFYHLIHYSSLYREYITCLQTLPQFSLLSFHLQYIHPL